MQTQRKYAIIIVGNDSYMYEAFATCVSFSEATRYADYLINSLSNQTIELLRVKSIEEIEVIPNTDKHLI